MQENVGRIFFVSVAILIAANIIGSYIYTGVPPWRFFHQLKDQNAAYLNMLNQIQNIPGPVRAIMIVIRGLAGPALVGIVAVMVLFYKNLKLPIKMLCLAGLFSSLYFSFMRGTDKETGDLLIFFCSSCLVLVFSRIMYSNLSLKRVFAIGLSVFICISLFMSIFIYRKSQRMGGVSSFCILGLACTNYESPVGRQLTRPLFFSIAMFSGYLSQGNFGMGIALEEPFESTYVAGSVPIAKPYLESWLGKDFAARSYLSKVTQAGWHDQYTWSGALTWFASDISFYGVPIFLLLVGFFFGRSWCDAIYHRRLSAVVVFSLILYFFAYLPANNQLFQSVEYFSGASVFVFIYLKDLLFVPSYPEDPRSNIQSSR